MKITHLKDTPNAPLGEASPVSVPLGEPVSHTRTAEVERPDQVDTGIWECTPGRWRRQIVEQEFCHFISGRGTFTPDDGEPIAFQAGDAFLLPQNSLGVWDIQETARKTYVIIKR
ncbi:cupin domain-containing protein [Pseudomonas citronellolis]|uniref:cupin domain-containing protein n=1 Tax=Pseudomonas citronellolis TaxID=53408 RepID=UPI0007185374|nr:cupin domain-containing protein [Pseudomonas citronellolis]KRV65266.1 cupin [Pseudomonas citronellolis]KRW75913.1 cupin [Pseudomonas citronellolis]WRT80036.1 cupin domain-containing protein [Pseudomonas citronellolis]